MKQDCEVLSGLGLQLDRSINKEQNLEKILNFLQNYQGDKYTITVHGRFSIDEQVGRYSSKHDIDRGLIFAKTPSVIYVYMQ